MSTGSAFPAMPPLATSSSRSPAGAADRTARQVATSSYGPTATSSSPATYRRWPRAASRLRRRTDREPGSGRASYTLILSAPETTVSGTTSDMLVFQQPFYEGHVLENSPGGSQVRALANIAVKHTHKYRITAGGMIRLSSFQILVLHTTQPLDRE